MDWKTRNESFEDMAAVRIRDFNVTGDGEPEKVYAYGVTANFFSVLGVPAKLGRTIADKDDRPEANKVAVISYSLWQSRYGGEAGIVNRDILLDGEKHTVVGVMPRGFQFLDPEVRIWVPAWFTPRMLANRGSHYLQVVARLKPGVTLEQANSDIKTITAQIAQDHPDEASVGGIAPEYL